MILMVTVNVEFSVFRVFSCFVRVSVATPGKKIRLSRTLRLCVQGKTWVRTRKGLNEFSS